jgi:hypothetical protein
MNDGALVQLSRAKLALAECKTAMESKQIADIAEAARVYLERTNASVDTVNQATEVRLLAERQMGAFLKEMPKNPGGSPIPRSDVEQPLTLKEIGITRKQSMTAQHLAVIPEPEFQERIAVAKASGGKLSTAKVLCPESAQKHSAAPAEPAPEPTSWANEYASMAINQLQKISRSDPKRPDALRRVMEWIAAELNK